MVCSDYFCFSRHVASSFSQHLAVFLALIWHLLLSSLRFSWRLRLSFTCWFFFTLHCIFSLRSFFVFVSHSSYAPFIYLLSSFHSTASAFICCVFSSSLRCFLTYLPCFTHEWSVLLLSISCCSAWCLLLSCAVSLCLSCTYSMCAGALHTCAAHFCRWGFPWCTHVCWCFLFTRIGCLSRLCGAYSYSLCCCSFLVPSLTYIFSFLGFDVHRSCTFLVIHPALHLYFAYTQDLHAWYTFWKCLSAVFLCF